MRQKPDGASFREWDRFCEWAQRLGYLELPEYLQYWRSWEEGRHFLMVAAELRQQDLMGRNTELVQKNRALTEEVQRLKTVLKEQL